MHPSIYLYICTPSGPTTRCATTLSGSHAPIYISIHLYTFWCGDQVRDELHALRGRDDEAELAGEAEAARSLQLSLQPLYAKPPPVWLHPAFAAEFGDAFISETGLDAVRGTIDACNLDALSRWRWPSSYE